LGSASCFYCCCYLFIVLGWGQQVATPSSSARSGWGCPGGAPLRLSFPPPHARSGRSSHWELEFLEGRPVPSQAFVLRGGDSPQEGDNPPKDFPTENSSFWRDPSPRPSCSSERGGDSPQQGDHPPEDRPRRDSGRQDPGRDTGRTPGLHRDGFRPVFIRVPMAPTPPCRAQATGRLLQRVSPISTWTHGPVLELLELAEGISCRDKH